MRRHREHKKYIEEGQKSSDRAEKHHMGKEMCDCVVI